MRRIEIASHPSCSSSSRAAATISCALGLSVSAALEAIAGAQTVTERAVETDVEGPGERTEERGERHEAEGRRDCECYGKPVAVQQVVEPDSARVELTLLEPRPDSDEKRDVGPEPARRELPARSVLDRFHDDGHEQGQGKDGVAHPASGATANG